MKPFPPADTMAFLLEQELAAIILNPWDMQFVFSDNTIIVAEHDIRYVDAARRVSVHDMQMDDIGPVMLHGLIGQKIVSLDVQAFRLELVFESEASLTILSRPGQYESGHILRADGSITVF